MRWRSQVLLLLLWPIVTLVHHLLAARGAVYRRWLGRRRVRERRRSARPLPVQLLKRTTLAVAGAVVFEGLRRLLRSGEHALAAQLRHREEAARLVADKAEAIRARPYDELARELRPQPHSIRLLAALAGVAAPEPRLEDERLIGPSGTHYLRRTSMHRDRSNAPIAVRVWLREEDAPAGLAEEFAIEPDTGEEHQQG